MEAADSALTLNTSSGSELRRYTRRFYRRVLNKRYEKNISLINGNYANWSSSLLYRTPMQKSVNFKAFFHIKVFFNLDEFLLYDFYNFHKSLLSVNFKDAEIPDKFIPKKPWKKLNFFFRIRYSIDIFRTHTLQFFKIKFRAERRTTVFFNSFKGVTALSYIWFFEYSLPYFLVKIRFAESISQGLVLSLNDTVFINSRTGFDRWTIVVPGDLVRLPFCMYLIQRIRWMILKFFDFFKKTKRFFKRTILRAKRYRTKMPNMTSKGVHLNASKHLHMRLLESDYKAMSVILIPYNNPVIYYSALTLFWLNFWNFRLNVWKYEI